MLVHLVEGGLAVPLNIETHTICKPDKAMANIRHALSLPYPWLHRAERPKGKTVSICGAGPSLADTYKDLSGDVMACNSAITWLDDRVNVDCAMMFDPHPDMVKFARRIPGCRYYLASRCDPAVFEALEGENIILWHAMGDAGMTELLEGTPLPVEKHEPLLHGGSTAVTRALYLAAAIGYSEIHIHGADSSMRDGETHIAGSIMEEEPRDVWALGKKYRTTNWLAQQAKEFQVLIGPLEAEGCTVTVHGDGMFPDIWRANGIEPGSVERAS